MAVLPSLVEAFLRWKYPELLTSTPTPTTSYTPAPTSADTPPLSLSSAIDVDPVSYDFSIDSVDLYTLTTSIIALFKKLVKAEINTK